MKILSKKILNTTGKGYVKLVPDYEDDLWYIYNIINIGDCIRASTFR